MHGFNLTDSKLALKLTNGFTNTVNYTENNIAFENKLRGLCIIKIQNMNVDIV